MKYELIIADRKEQVIMNYRNVELIAEDHYHYGGNYIIKRMRFDCDPLYSADPEHPDYIEFSVFPDDKVVNVYELEWTNDELFGEGYMIKGFATYVLVDLKEMGA